MRLFSKIALFFFLLGIITSCSKYEVNPTNTAEEEVTDQRSLLITDEVEQSHLESESNHERKNPSLRLIDIESDDVQDTITDDDDDDDDSAEAQDKSSK